jgi:hypothetical protein
MRVETISADSTFLLQIPDRGRRCGRNEVEAEVRSVAARNSDNIADLKCLQQFQVVRQEVKRSRNIVN